MAAWAEDYLQQLVSPVTSATVRYTGESLIFSPCFAFERRYDDLSGLRRPHTVGSARSHRPVHGCVCGGICGMGALRPVRQEKVCSVASMSHGRRTVRTVSCLYCRAMLSSCVISIAHAIVTNIIAGSQVHRAQSIFGTSPHVDLISKHITTVVITPVAQLWTSKLVFRGLIFAVGVSVPLCPGCTEQSQHQLCDASVCGRLSCQKTCSQLSSLALRVISLQCAYVSAANV